MSPAVEPKGGALDLCPSSDLSHSSTGRSFLRHKQSRSSLTVMARRPMPNIAIGQRVASLLSVCQASIDFEHPTDELAGVRADPPRSSSPKTYRVVRASSFCFFNQPSTSSMEPRNASLFDVQMVTNRLLTRQFKKEGSVVPSMREAWGEARPDQPSAPACGCLSSSDFQHSDADVA